MPVCSIFSHQVEKLGLCKGQDSEVYVNTTINVPTEKPSWTEFVFLRKDDSPLSFLVACTQPISAEKAPLRPSVGFKALTDCLSIMQEAPDHYTSPCVRSVEQRLLEFTNAPTYRANCKCCHAVHRMLICTKLFHCLWIFHRCAVYHCDDRLVTWMLFFPHIFGERVPSLWTKSESIHAFRAASSSVGLWAAKHDSAAMPTRSATNPPPICFSSSGFAKECFSSCYRQTE